MSETMCSKFSSWLQTLSSELTGVASDLVEYAVMEDRKIGHAALITHGYNPAMRSEHSQCNLCSLLNSTISSADGNKMFLTSHRVLQLCGLRTRNRARFLWRSSSTSGSQLFVSLHLCSGSN